MPALLSIIRAKATLDSPHYVDKPTKPLVQTTGAFFYGITEVVILLHNL